MNEANTMADIIGQPETDDQALRRAGQPILDRIEVDVLETVEQEIQRKGLTAPRVTPAQIEANIASEHYFTAEDGVLGAYKRNNDVYVGSVPNAVSAPALALLTICVLVLRNGYTVHGVSACASPENFNAQLGQRIARENAVREIWPLMGYTLREVLHATTARTPIWPEVAAVVRVDER